MTKKAGLKGLKERLAVAKVEQEQLRSLERKALDELKQELAAIEADNAKRKAFLDQLGRERTF